MRIQKGLLAIVGAAALSLVAAGAAAEAAAPGSQRLRAFDGCDALIAYAKRQALPLVGPYGLNGGPLAIAIGALPPSAARESGRGLPVAGTDYSTTNVQDDGVDEPDLVKTDGRHVFVVSGGRVSAIDARGSRPRLVGTLPLEKGWNHELLLHGGRLLVLSQAASLPMPVEGARGLRAP